MTREDNEAGGYSCEWEYDEAGNIMTAYKYAYTTGNLGSFQDVEDYVYDDLYWGDLLSMYNGQLITYDTIGNPLSDGSRTYTWQHGRELKRITLSADGSVWNFTYNADGMRTQRACGDTVYRYTYNGSQLSQMTIDNGTTTSVEYTMYFTYDAAGVPVSVTLNDTTYYYVTNLQGDVIAILDVYGYAVANYVYDAWGNILVDSYFIREEDIIAEQIRYVADFSPDAIGRLNPLRYRGYVYDTETGLYYLQSRYYNPEWGRFISSDNVIPNVGGDILGYNLFAYCLNNPVNMADPDGKWAQWINNAIKGFAGTIAKVKAILQIPVTKAKIICASVVAVAFKQATIKEVVDDIKNYRFFNTDESKVLSSNVFSSYNGTPVIRHNISFATSCSISNTIFLKKTETINNGGVDTVKHEWGHTVQQSLIGSSKYISRIAIPSVLSCIQNPPPKTYFSLPYERSADYFGGVNRSTGYDEGSELEASIYLIIL